MEYITRGEKEKRHRLIILTDMENLEGSDFDDTLVGDEYDNTLIGWEGGTVQNGVDLGALPVVWNPDVKTAIRSVEHLLRSNSFGISAVQFT